MGTQELEGRHSHPATTDRRTVTRVIMDLPVAVISEGFRHECRTIDLSLTGMVIHLNPALAGREPHLVYAYEIEVGHGLVIHLTGRTAWRRGGLQGVRFVVVDPTDRRTLGDVIDDARRERASDFDRLELAERIDRQHARKSA